MSSVVVDTNVLIRLFKGENVVAELLSAADQILVPITVMGEFLAGISCPQSQTMTSFRQFLSLPFVTIVRPNEGTAQYYAEIYRRLKTAGTPIPTNDIWILAETLNQKASVCSYDSHFDLLPDINRIH